MYTSGHFSEPELSVICAVVNISESGMLFATSKKFDVSKVLRLTFLLPDSFVINRADALVVHSMVQKRKFEIGVQYKHIGLAERKLINHFVNKAIPNFKEQEAS